MRAWLLTVALVFAWQVAATPQETPRQVEVYLEQGALQPLLQVNTIDQQSLSLQQEGPRTVLILFATWCHDSQRLFQQLLEQGLPELDVRYIAIGRGESVERLKEFRLKYPVAVHFVADPDEKIYQQFTNTGLPRVLMFNQQQRLVHTFLGEIPQPRAAIVWPKP